MDIFGQLLAWENAGEVAILVLVLVGLGSMARWLLTQLIRDKDAQIQRLAEANDKLTNEVGVTLSQILSALRDRREERL